MPKRKEESEKRLKKLAANANDDEIRGYYDACARAEIEPSDTLRKLAHALRAHVDEYGSVTFPLRLAAPAKKKA